MRGVWWISAGQQQQQTRQEAQLLLGVADRTAPYT